jgi:soluble lytic murein transglycosylase-like protein
MIFYWENRLLTGVAIIPFLISCAGPTTPFGAIDSLEPLTSKQTTTVNREARKPASSETYSSIRYTPDRQVLHDQTPFEIEIRSNEKIKDNYEISLLFNGYDVTKKFLNQCRKTFSADKQTLTLLMKNLRLRADRDNSVQIKFRSSPGGPILTSTLRPPFCTLDPENTLSTTLQFKPGPSIIELIKLHSRSNNINPAVTAGLIAQESGFNPLAVSWSKAIGLTQITPLAAEEIEKFEPQWPRHEEITELSPIALKTRVLAGEIAYYNEWTLNPELSIIGGIHYLKYLIRYWQSKDSQETISQALRRNSDTDFTKIILASYNSGAMRVKRALRRKGKDWLTHKDLKEARKYVSKVFSYCYHFGKKEES